MTSDAGLLLPRSGCSRQADASLGMPGTSSATRGKLLDGQPLSEDSRVHRATRVASDLIGRTAREEARSGATQRGVSLRSAVAEGNPLEPQRSAGPNAPRTSRGRYREHAGWVTRRYALIEVDDPA